MGKGDPKGGRPRKEIDFGQLETMAKIQCTAEECAAIFGIDVDTLDARIREETGSGFSDYHKKHSVEGKASLRRAQFRRAIGTPADPRVGQAEILASPTMLIWLGKQWLGQEDKLTHAVDVPDGTRAVFEVIVPIMGKGKGNGRDLTTEDRPDPDPAPGAD